jgi:hypothetical protein
MGITGIWNFKSEDKKGVHDDIRRVLLQCKVKNIVLIYDADFDSLNSKFGDNEEANLSIDLADRVNSFYKAAIEFKNFVQNIVQDFIVVAPKNKEYKGIDDLLNYYKIDTPASSKVIYELLKTPISKSKFEEMEVINITQSKNRDTRKFFAVEVNDFWLRHSNRLLDKSFVFNRNTYFGNSANDRPELKIHGESTHYARIGTKYVKLIMKPDPKNNLIREIKDWTKSTLIDDYVNKGHKNFIETIPKYDDFVNVPINDPEEYQREIINQSGQKFYNLYEKIDHMPAKGDWSNTKKYLEHIFEDHYKLSLDYLYIIFTNPTEKLPILCLVSREGGTGKTTFIEYLISIYQNNAVKIGNQELADSFNDDYASKLIIGVDEGLIEKAENVEKLKNWATSSTIQMNKKNVSRSPIPFIAKIIMTSNHTDNFIRISEHEERFWVREIKKVKGKSDPFLLEKMTDEIPAFLYYLKNEHKPMYPKRLTRFYFPMSAYETTALRNLKKRSKSNFERNFKMIIKDLFLEYNFSATQTEVFHTLYFTLNEIKDLDETFKRLDKNYIESELRLMHVEKSDKVQRVIIPRKDTLSNDIRYEPEVTTKRGPYIFPIEDYLSEEEIKNIKELDNTLDITEPHNESVF